MTIVLCLIGIGLCLGYFLGFGLSLPSIYFVLKENFRSHKEIKDLKARNEYLQDEVIRLERGLLEAIIRESASLEAMIGHLKELIRLRKDNADLDERNQYLSEELIRHETASDEALRRKWYEDEYGPGSALIEGWSDVVPGSRDIN